MFLHTAFPHPPVAVPAPRCACLSGPRARGLAHPGEGRRGCPYFSVVSACLNPADCTLLRNTEPWERFPGLPRPPPVSMRRPV